MPPANPALRPHLAPRQKVWLNWDGVFLMCPRSLRFLAAVERRGTIRAAGHVVGCEAVPVFWTGGWLNHAARRVRLKRTSAGVR